MQAVLKSFVLAIGSLLLLVLMDLLFKDYSLQSFPLFKTLVRFIIFFAGYLIAFKVAKRKN